jgi:hypothetical protein
MSSSRLNGTFSSRYLAPCHVSVEKFRSLQPVRTLGSRLSGQGYNLQLIGKALHHSSLSTTHIYARLDINPLREALERNARLMFEVILKVVPELVRSS